MYASDIPSKRSFELLFLIVHWGPLERRRNIYVVTNASGGLASILCQSDCRCASNGSSMNAEPAMKPLKKNSRFLLMVQSGLPQQLCQNISGIDCFGGVKVQPKSEDAHMSRVLCCCGRISKRYKQCVYSSMSDFRILCTTFLCTMLSRAKSAVAPPRRSRHLAQPFWL